MAQKFLDLETGLPELWKKTTEKIEIATSTKLDSEDYLGPVVMEGNPLRFDNGVEGLNIAVTEQVLEPVQAGSGAPSLENIRAITGWTGANLTRRGKNLYTGSPNFDSSWINYKLWSVVDETYLGMPVLKRNGEWGGVSQDISVTKGITYTFSLYAKASEEKTANIYLSPPYVQIFDIATVKVTLTTSWQRYEVTAMCTESGLCRQRIETETAGSDIFVSGFQLEIGNEATSYEAYHGNDFTAIFPQTIYGGTLNWTTGVMTVDRKLYTFTGSDTSAYMYTVLRDNSDTVQQVNVSINSLGAELDSGEACTHFVRDTNVTSASKGSVVGFCIYGDHTIVFGIPKATLLQYGTADNNTSSEWTALANAFFADQYAAGTPVQVAYKLAEPYTIQLTPQEIKQLNGTNILYGDGTSLRAIFNASASSPVDTNLSTTSSNPVQNKTVTSSINSLKSVATASSAGLMSATDKSKLDTITTSADSVSFSQSATSGNKVGTITINGTAIDMYSPIQTTISGNAATATKVSNVLTIQANGSSLGTFDGSSAKTFNITYSNVGAAASSHGTHVSYGTSASALGTSSAGSASTVSRSDHVHALPALTSCTGTLTIAKGGTGATSAANARSNLGIKSGTTLPTSGSVGDIFFLY